MDCARGRAVAGLYDELMVDILSRVPVKDLRCSTCVSKAWCDLITDPLNRKKLPRPWKASSTAAPVGVTATGISLACRGAENLCL
jgi:hypothetical protein